MSKKSRPKKKYKPRAVAVPPFLNSLDSLGCNEPSVEPNEKDRIFLLQVANRTVTSLSDLRI